MDFTLDEEQQAVADLANQVFADALAPDLQTQRLRIVENTEDWFDRDLWQVLADAGLLGIALGVDVGGAGLDAVALALLLRAQGAHVAPMPLLPSAVASLVVDRHGDDTQRQTLLPGVVAGTTILTVAIQELLDDRLEEPSCSFMAESSDGYLTGRLTGRKVVVEHLDTADYLLITASTADGPRVILVNRSSEGIAAQTGPSTRLQPLSDVTFTDAPGQVVGGPTAVTALLDHLRMGVCATQLGVTERALALTAEYTSTREQFGRPIATFQAVGQRLADQFVNVGGIRLATLSAAWRLANNRDATEDLLVAKWWASERATDVANATQHVHGGMGVATDYPLHRYTLWNKHLAMSLGAGNQALRGLGALLAE
ncbi:MAG: acyl-CoA dehydrogenase family protein [Acidimicrobiales bacterium]|nr:acyl-CoA dehydrogenase family protein [Acidimicrobiales bacterium]